MKHTHVTFENSYGEKLSGRIDLPLIETPKAFVLFAHCFTCSKNLKSAAYISHSFIQMEMGVLHFDFTGLGQSDGHFSDTNFGSNLADLKAAYRYLERTFEAPQILVGHSLGGIAALHVARELEHVRAVATIGAPSTPTHVKGLFAQKKEDIEKTGEAQVNIGGRPFKIKKQFLDDLGKRNSKEVIREMGKALLILHSPQDTVVGIDNARDIYSHAMHPKSFIALDKADHLLSSEADANYAARMIANWASGYVTLENPKEAPEGDVLIRIGDGFATEIIAGKHHMRGDEPTSVGGTDTGPAPYGYLLSALGSCTAMTMRMYANRKGIPIEEIKLKLTHEKVFQTDREHVGSASKIDQINIDVEFRGSLSEEQKIKLLQIAEKCPVHKTLKGTPQITIHEIG